MIKFRSTTLLKVISELILTSKVICTISKEVSVELYIGL